MSFTPVIEGESNLLLANEPEVTQQLEIVEDDYEIEKPIENTNKDTTVIQSQTSQNNSETIWKYPELKRICSCESTGSPNNEPQHYLNGSVIRGRINSSDVGMCQINEYYHDDAAISLGLDLENKEDNLSYAEHLYETQGNQPWFWSEHCWGK